MKECVYFKHYSSIQGQFPRLSIIIIIIIITFHIPLLLKITTIKILNLGLAVTLEDQSLHILIIS